MADREVLAFDLYGTLVDPIAIAGESCTIICSLTSSGLGEFFGERISVDEVRAFKPSPLVYRHAAGRLSRPIGQVRLVTSNVFDCVGADAAGMRTAWVNRSAGPFDTLGEQPGLSVAGLDDLPAALPA